MSDVYKDPVARLLSLGRPVSNSQRFYRNLGITNADIPELVRLLEDKELYNLPRGEDDREPAEAYAAVHAWRALGELKAVEAIPALIGLLRQIDENDDDWIEAEIPRVLGTLGEPAVEPCRLYLLDTGNPDYARLAAAQALLEITNRQEDQTPRCSRALTEALEIYRQNSDTVNAFLINHLADLKAVETAPLVRQVFDDDRADLLVMGDYEDFQVKVGLLKKRLTPPPDYFGSWSGQAEPPPLTSEEHKRSQQKEKKEKAKKKQEKKSRKRNKRR
jgi:hypothetical protein